MNMSTNVNTCPANKWNQHVFVFSCVCSGYRVVFQGTFWAIEHCTRNIPTGAISKLYSCTWLGYYYDKPLKQSVQLKVGVVIFLFLSPHTRTLSQNTSPFFFSSFLLDLSCITIAWYQQCKVANDRNKITLIPEKELWSPPTLTHCQDQDPQVTLTVAWDSKQWDLKAHNHAAIRNKNWKTAHAGTGHTHEIKGEETNERTTRGRQGRG